MPHFEVDRMLMNILFGNLETHVGSHIFQLISWECLLCLDPQTKIKQGQKVKSHYFSYTLCSHIVWNSFYLIEGWELYTFVKHFFFFEFQNDVNITDANFYANITEKKLAEILKSDSDTPIPLLEERVAVLREAGKVLLEVSEKSKLMYTSKMF